MIDRKFNGIASVERLRIVAVFGIVWFHNIQSPGQWIGYAGLPIFLMFFSVFLIKSGKCYSFKQQVKKKFIRFIIPWLFWSSIYIAVLIGKRILAGNSSTEEMNALAWLIGTSLHLWFLPYAFVIAIFLPQIYARIRHLPALWLALAGIIWGMVSLWLVSWLMPKWGLPAPFAQWVFSVPALFLGSAIGFAYYHLDRKKLFAVLFIMLGLTLLLCGSSAVLGYSGMIRTYSLSIVLVSGAFFWEGRPDHLTLKWASLSYGIYLIHPAVMTAVHYFFRDGIDVWTCNTMVFLVSTVIILVMKKTPLKIFV